MRNRSARLTAKSNSKHIRSVGSTRNTLGVRLSRPQTEVLKTDAIHARQIEAVVRQHDRFFGKASTFFVQDIVLTETIFL
jgi:hypothetical protein